MEELTKEQLIAVVDEMKNTTRLAYFLYLRKVNATTDEASKGADEWVETQFEEILNEIKQKV